MKKIFLATTLLVATYIHAIEFGTLATASKTGKYDKLGNDISSLLKNYNINLTPITTGGSYENMSIMNGKFIEDKNTFLR